jgi:hypothetical protein
MKSRLIVAVVATLLMSGLTVYAHHSFSATYDTGKTMKIEGKVTQFLLRNPHSFLHVDTKDESGRVQNWNVEWAAAGQLGGAGMTTSTLKVGDVVEITGNPGRDPADYRLRMVSLKRTSDGLSWGFQPGQVVN